MPLKWHFFAIFFESGIILLLYKVAFKYQMSNRIQNRQNSKMPKKCHFCKMTFFASLKTAKNAILKRHFLPFCYFAIIFSGLLLGGVGLPSRLSKPETQMGSGRVGSLSRQLPSQVQQHSNARTQSLICVWSPLQTEHTSFFPPIRWWNEGKNQNHHSYK
jgi:hypothetical protein